MIRKSATISSRASYRPRFLANYANVFQILPWTQILSTCGSKNLPQMVVAKSFSTSDYLYNNFSSGSNTDSSSVNRETGSGYNNIEKFGCIRKSKKTGNDGVFADSDETGVGEPKEPADDVPEKPSEKRKRRSTRKSLFAEPLKEILDEYVKENSEIGNKPEEVDWKEEILKRPLIDPDFKALKPDDIVKELDMHIVGQKAAKRCVSIALRNRWRRQQLEPSMRDEVSPKNILMIGATGVGKTEIGRRLAKLAQAPFVKVEATKFTEVGFHGLDVDKIVQDLVETSIHLTREIRMEQQRENAEKMIEEKIVEALVGSGMTASRETIINMLTMGELDDYIVTVEVPHSSPRGVQVEVHPGPVALSQVFENIANMSKGVMPKSKEKKRLSVKEARVALLNAELDTRLESAEIVRDAINLAEQHGIVFIDEIDKICSNGESRGTTEASAEGVQRDLLPLIEGSVIHTKHGNVNTDHVLFIASGAFHMASPSDLLPELQGRLPIRVELESLNEKELHQILTEPKANLLNQQKFLMATEGLDIEFSKDAIAEMARVAALVNRTVHNIGARRLQTIVERVMEDISFSAADLVNAFKDGSSISKELQSEYAVEAVEGNSNPRLVITKDMVKSKIGDLLDSVDYKRFIL